MDADVAGGTIATVRQRTGISIRVGRGFAARSMMNLSVN